MQGLAKAFTRVTRSKHHDISVSVENGHPALTLQQLCYYYRSGSCRVPLLHCLRPREKTIGEFTQSRRSSTICGLAAYQLTNATPGEMHRNSHADIPNADVRPAWRGHHVWLMIAWEITTEGQCRFALELLETEQPESSHAPISGITEAILAMLLDLLQSSNHGQHVSPKIAWPMSLDRMYLAGEQTKRHCMLENGMSLTVTASMQEAKDVELVVTLSEERFESRSIVLTEPLPLNIMLANVIKEQ
jgi:hypothetical protein